MKNTKQPEEDEKASTIVKPTPEHGAESQLHCYNSVSWRLGRLLDADDEPEPPKAEK